MKMTEGELLAWRVVAPSLQDVAPDEVAFIVDIIEAVHDDSQRPIDGISGAFDYDSLQLSTAAVTLFGIVVGALKGAAPKMFDALVDIAKDRIKDALKKGPSPAAAAMTTELAADIHATVHRSALSKNLSEKTARALADAVVSQLAIGQRQR